MDPAIFAKFLLNGLIAGSLYAVLAIGLALVYGILRFVNLAHGEFALIGAYSFYTFYVDLGWPLVPSFVAGTAVVFAIVFVIEKFLLRSVRDAPELIPLIISIGLSIFIKNALLMAYEPYARSYPHELRTFSFFADAIRVTDIQIIIIIASLLLMAGLWAFLKYTRTGRAIRAVSDSRELAAILGIPINRIVVITFLIAGFLASTAGILAAFDQNLHPNLGLFFTVKSFAAVILGGIGSIPGAVAGAYFIGLAENLLIAIPFAGWYIPSSYKDAIAFVALLIILYIKPTGFFGSRKTESARK